MPPAPARAPSPARPRASEAAPAAPARKKPAAAGPSPLAAAPPKVKLAVVRATEARGGEPLAPDVKRELERSFRTDLSAVRVHHDGNAHHVAVTLAARAVTHGTHVFLGPGESADNLPLLAHEVAHVVQQRGGAAPQAFSQTGGDHFEHEAQRASAAAVRGESFAVRERTSRPRVQRFGISNILDKLAGMANAIPGFRLFTIVLGVNPVNMSSVPRTAANILRAAVEIIPGGALITAALDGYGIFDKIGAWVEQQINSLGMVGSAIRAGLMKFIDSIELTDLVPWNLGKLADKALDTLTAPVKQLWNFVVGLGADILKFIKDALLMPLAKLAEGTRGYDLLKALLGKDPVTGDPVPRTAETLIPGFLKLIGEEETWENMQKSRAIPRVWAWFQGAVDSVLGFVREFPAMVVSTIKSLTLSDVFPPTGVLVKVAKAFGDFIGRFISWIGTALWNLLEIIFQVVSPGAWTYIQKTGAALKSILKNPLPFVGNLIKAAKGGFNAFADNFGSHLKAGLISWLTGALEGVYIPKSFELRELVMFVLSVLGLTWGQIRPKLVRATNETAVKAMEAGFDLVVTLVTKGPAAFWDQLKSQLASLRDQVIGGITDLIISLIVTKAIPKIIAMFIPGAGFIGLILSIYDTVMTFVNRLKQIIAAVTAFIDSIVAIAAGNIGAAVKKVESVLAGLLSLAIAFLFGFAGLGKVADKVMGVIKKIRAPIDKALDALINWVVGMAKKLGKLVASTVEPRDRLTAAVASVNKAAQAPKANVGTVEAQIPAILKEHALVSVKLVRDKKGKYHVEAVVNPSLRGSPTVLFTAAELAEIEAIGQRWATQIKTKGDKPKYLADKKGYLTGGKAKVATGELIEAAGVEEVAAYAKGMTVIKNASIRFVDAAGATIGGAQAELDFLVLGTASEVDIISAKLKAKQFRPSVDRAHLNHYVTMPLTPPGIVTYAQTHFGKVAAYVNIASANVVYAGGAQSLAAFRAAHLSKVVVSAVTINKLTPADPAAATGIQTVATEAELFDKVIEFIDRYI